MGHKEINIWPNTKKWLMSNLKHFANVMFILADRVPWYKNPDVLGKNCIIPIHLLLFGLWFHIFFWVFSLQWRWRQAKPLHLLQSNSAADSRTVELTYKPQIPDEPEVIIIKNTERWGHYWKDGSLWSTFKSGQTSQSKVSHHILNFLSGNLSAQH